MDKLYNTIILGIPFFLKIKKGRAIHCMFLVFNTLKQERMPFLSLIQLKIQIHFHVTHIT